MTWSSGAVFLLVNVIAYLHAYRFTHFENDSGTRTKDPSELSLPDKATVVITGVYNPRPCHTRTPTVPFAKIQIEANPMLEVWRIDVPQSKGLIVMFHGYAGEKSSLLERSNELNKLGYSTALVDFQGSGGSSGNSTSIGYHEADQVLTTFQYFKQQGEEKIILFGTSMGSAAILKALYDQQDKNTLNPAGIVLECPFGSLYKTVCARFSLMNIPTVPMAALLTFWGGVQHGYWAFSHNPAMYAEAVHCPALLIYGEQDDRVSMEETKTIFSTMKGKKILRTYPDAGHQVFTEATELRWIQDVNQFVSTL